jgi:transposase-like protein
MPMSIYQKAKIEKKKEQARVLYRSGMSTRQVARAMDCSHSWVAEAVKKINNISKT